MAMEIGRRHRDEREVDEWKTSVEGVSLACHAARAQSEP